MNRNEIKATLRNLRRDKLSALINLGGLAIGMACCMLIIVYIRYELSYNTFNTHLKDIYRVNWITKVNGQVTPESTTPVILGPVIASQLPGIRSVARTYVRGGQMSVSVKKFHESGVYFADNSLFSIFTIHFLKGDAATALNAPGQVVITDQIARKYFGSADPIGKRLLYDNKALLQVSGVVQTMPENSDVTFDFLISFETLFAVEPPAMADFIRRDWLYNPATTYCLVNPGVRQEEMNRELNGLFNRYADKRSIELHTIQVQPLRDIHLKASDILANPSTDSMTYIYIFAGIAFLILLTANVNFINLSMARATTRAREISMRKVLGAGRPQLIRQFLEEHLLICFLSFLLALALVSLCMPVLNELTEKNLSRLAWLNVTDLGVFLLVFLCMGLLAGMYPAFFMTRFKGAASLKGKSGETVQRNTLRKTLLVTQFSISIVLAIAAVVVFRQLQYLRNKPLGFQREQMITVPLFGSGASSADYSVDAALRQRMNTFTDELLKYSKIKAATAASDLPGQDPVKGLVIPQGFTGKDNIFVPWISVDYNFISTFHMALVAGRDFSKQTGTDHLSAFILNESAVKSFGWQRPADALGKTIIRGEEQKGKRGLVIGVIRDYNFNTLDKAIQPLILDVNPPRFTQFAIQIQPDHIPSTIAYIQRTWDTFFPERAFESSFLDRDIDALYNDKERLSRMMEYFSCIAILLSAVGLFSLTAFLTIQRTREIGIRKVLGASAINIVTLLSADFLRMCGLAFVIAAPIAWYIMHSWLQQYAYHTGIPWWIFALAGMLGLIITALSVGLQGVKAALADPVKSLRTE